MSRKIGEWERQERRAGGDELGEDSERVIAGVQSRQGLGCSLNC